MFCVTCLFLSFFGDLILSPNAELPNYAREPELVRVVTWYFGIRVSKVWGCERSHNRYAMATVVQMTTTTVRTTENIRHQKEKGPLFQVVNHCR